MIAIELYKLIRQKELFVTVLYSHGPHPLAVGKLWAWGCCLCLQPPPQSGRAGTKDEFAGEGATKMLWLYLQK